MNDAVNQGGRQDRRRAGPPRAGVLRQRVKGAACMRTHGYPSWPDPAVRNGQINSGTPPNVDQNSAQFQTAGKACGPA